jgi:DNA polymerase III subunit epsilon
MGIPDLGLEELLNPPDRLAEAIALVESHGHRVLAPFIGGPREYGKPIDSHTCRGIMVDTETTGPDVARDQIIQLALVPFVFDRKGNMVSVSDARTYYEEPTVPVSAEARAVHDIEPERYRGQRFPVEEIAALFADADLVLAHNAAFDRPMLDRRFPALPPSRWGCSYNDIPWRKAGYPSAALGALLMSHTSSYFAGHDAAADCYAALHCLAHSFVHPAFIQYDWLPLSHVIRAVETPVMRVFAGGAPFETKDALQQRGYKWNDPFKAGAAFPRAPKAWWREVPADAMDAEYEWLDRHAYPGALSRLRASVFEVPVTARFARGGAAESGR